MKSTNLDADQFNQKTFVLSSPTVFDSEKQEEQLMDSREQSEVLGKALFYLTLVAVLVFFWWLLIYDHGITSAVS